MNRAEMLREVRMERTDYPSTGPRGGAAIPEKDRKRPCAPTPTTSPPHHPPTAYGTFNSSSITV